MIPPGHKKCPYPVSEGLYKYPDWQMVSKYRGRCGIFLNREFYPAEFLENYVGHHVHFDLNDRAYSPELPLYDALDRLLGKIILTGWNSMVSGRLCWFNGKIGIRFLDKIYFPQEPLPAAWAGDTIYFYFKDSNDSSRLWVGDSWNFHLGVFELET